MNNYQKINTVCLFILTTIALAFVFAQTKIVLIPFTLSVFIYFIYSPILIYLNERFRVPKMLSLAVSLILMVLLLLSVTNLISNSVNQFAAGADQYRIKLTLLTAQTIELLQQIGFPIEVNEIQETLKNLPFASYFGKITSNILFLMSNTFLVVVFTTFLLTGDSLSTRKIKTLEEIKLSISKYAATKFVSSSITALLTYTVLLIFDVEMAFMFAMLTFILNFIPNVGSIIAVLLTVPVLFLQFNFGVQFFVVFILLGSIQVVIGNFLEPKFMGETLGLHPVTILLFLTFWGYIWGLAGMFLSVPITAILKILLLKYNLTRPVGHLLAGHVKRAN